MFGAMMTLVPGNKPYPAAGFLATQRSLYELGFDVDVTGTYDAKTSAAVLEFRGAAGLPYVDQIDDAFDFRLAQEWDAASAEDRLRKAKAGGGIGLLALLVGAYFATR